MLDGGVPKRSVREAAVAKTLWFRDGDYHRIFQKKNPGWSRVYEKVLRGGVVRETKWFLKRVTRGQPSAFSLRFRLTC